MNLTYSTHEFSKNWIVNWGNDHTFFVYGNGWIYSRGSYIGSDTAFKENIEVIEAPIEKVIRLRGVLYNSKKITNMTDTVRVMDNNGIWHLLTSDQYEYLDTTKFKAAYLEQLIAERDMKHMGVLAQEVRDVVPEVVRTMPDGKLAVEYYSLIGLLIEAIKEQEKKIDELASRELMMPKGNGLGLNNDANINEINFLYQNTPNPFSKSTIIKYKLASSAIESSIMIFNMQGNLMVTRKGLDSQKGEITIYGYELKPGMYMYSLIIDGKEIDTKRMILTE